MLWIGASIGPVERACIRSVLRQGHPLRLWTYSPPARVPDGVEMAEARLVLPESAIIRHRNGSVALFANRFRYRLQQLGLGAWLDTDIYLIRPFSGSNYLLTEEAPGLINNAPFKTPPDSPLLAPLLALFEEKTVPSWLPLRDRIAARLRLLTTGRSGLSRMPWGVAGPRAVTALARQYGLDHLASPPETFHPFSWTEADWILDPARTLDQRATEATVGVHLWNECIKGFKDKPAPPGSFLARLQAEGA